MRPPLGADAGTQRSDLLKAITGLVPNTESRHRQLRPLHRSGGPGALARPGGSPPARNGTGRSDRQGASGQPPRSATPDRLYRVHAHAPAETEAVRARLRAEIYGKAASELEALKRSFPGRKFRIGNIDFADQPPMAYARKTREDMQPMVMAASPAQDGPVNVSEKLVVHARVVRLRRAPRE